MMVWVVVVIAVWLAAAELCFAKWEHVAQEWDKYMAPEGTQQRREQRAWFQDIRPKRAGPRCCDEADGHPVDALLQIDGWYVPNIYYPDHAWVKVPPDAFTQPGNNPFGTAVVWFGALNNEGIPFVRCFVPPGEY